MFSRNQLATTRRPFISATRRRIPAPAMVAVPVALLSLLTACGGSDTTSAGSTSSSAPAPSETPATSTTSTTSGDDSKVLTGTVGVGDAFVITLVDSAGAPVTSLKAGKYTVKVKDASAIHNFHLVGTGVDEQTTVPEVKDTTWTVELVAGSYTFKCDPHAKMTGSFSVT